MLVSSEDEMNRLKASDAQLVLNPSGDMPQHHLRALTPPIATPSRATFPAPSKTILPPAQNPSGFQIEVDNAEQDSDKAAGKTAAEKEAEAKIPVSFKCAHCYFSAPQVEKLKSHLLMRHSAGSVIYALDMKAVKLRQQRYVFFCLKNNCKYHSKDMDDFIQHTDECSPWLQGLETTDVDKLLIKVAGTHRAVHYKDWQEQVIRECRSKGCVWGRVRMFLLPVRLEQQHQGQETCHQ